MTNFTKACQIALKRVSLEHYRAAFLEYSILSTELSFHVVPVKKKVRQNKVARLAWCNNITFVCVIRKLPIMSIPLPSEVPSQNR